MSKTIKKFKVLENDLKYSSYSIGKYSHRLIHTDDPELFMYQISEYICSFFKDITVEMLRTRSQEDRICIPRHLSMYVIRLRSNFSAASIGKYFGNRSHQPVLKALKLAESLTKTNIDINLLVEEVLSNIIKLELNKKEYELR